MKPEGKCYVAIAIAFLPEGDKVISGGAEFAGIVFDTISAADEAGDGWEVGAFGTKEFGAVRAFAYSFREGEGIAPLNTAGKTDSLRVFKIGIAALTIRH